MTDFDYDAYQKKRIASGDRHRKRGNKSKYCGLPSDHMTQAQWKKKNGEVKTMNLNEPMNWQTFKSLPSDLQGEYVSKLVARFHCNLKDFGTMFGVQTPTVSGYFKAAGIDMTPFGKGKYPNKADRLAFLHWIGAGDLDSVSPHTEPDCPNPATAPAVAMFEDKVLPELRALASAGKLDLEWSGDVNLLEVMTLLHRFAGDAPLRLHITAEHI